MDPIFTPAELAEVEAYARPYYVWIALRDVVNLAFFALVLRFAIRPMYAGSAGLAAALDRRLGGMRSVPVVRAIPAAFDKLWRGPGWGTALLFSLAYLLLQELVFLPRDVYFELHDQRFGTSNYTLATYVVDDLKRLLILSVASSFLAFGLYGLARRLRFWWLILGVVAGGAMLFSSVLDPYRGKVFFEQSPLPPGEARDRITKLMAQANIEFADVLVEKTSRASKFVNAYFAGQGPTRTIVLNDTLVETFTTDEVVAAVAHEAGHVHEARWPRRIATSLLVLAMLFAVHQVFKLVQRRGWFGVTEYADIRTLPLVGLLLYLLLAVGMPFSSAWSRDREREADRFALELTGDPAAFRRMLVKLARVNKADPDPPRWVVLRSMSHPPLSERLARVAAFERKENTSGR